MARSHRGEDPRPHRVWLDACEPCSNAGNGTPSGVPRISMPLPTRSVMTLAIRSVLCENHGCVARSDVWKMAIQAFFDSGERWRNRLRLMTHM